MQRDNSAGDNTIISRDSAAKGMRTVLRDAIIVEKRFTVAGLAARTGIKPRRLEMYMSETENKEPPLSVALSILEILKGRAVNDIIAMIGFVGMPIDQSEAKGPAQDAVSAMEEVTRFARCAIDNRIDHVEKPIATDAADNVIELLAPYSSRHRA
ncbi:MAG: hypothetical protein JWL86_45 [Rhizobium sp.]|nr:hypothetical protein [Rhizobium sp.]